MFLQAYFDESGSREVGTFAVAGYCIPSRSSQKDDSWRKMLGTIETRAATGAGDTRGFAALAFIHQLFAVEREATEKDFSFEQRKARQPGSPRERFSKAFKLWLEPYAYLRALFERLPSHPADRLHELAPADWAVNSEPR